MKNIILILLVFTLVVSCSKNTEVIKKELPPFNTVTRGKEVVKKNNEFAFKIFKKIETENPQKNTFFSPVSLSLALAMTYNGAEKETKKAFENTLLYNNFNRDEINNVNKKLLKYLFDDSSGSEFKIANSIWINKNFTIKQPFIDVVKNDYEAQTSKLDFSNLNSVNTINNWVSNKTQGKISKIIEQTNSNSVLYLMNALYFNGIWKYQFEKNKTQKMPFTNKIETKKVDMMQLEENIPFYENDEFSAITLPYKEDKFSMTILLPKSTKTIQDLNKNLTQKTWENWSTNFKNKKVKVSLPKFKFSYKQELNDILKLSGLEKAFSRKADFTSLTTSNVQITKVLQKTFVDVNEEGTEAAAVTVIDVEFTSIDPVSIFKINKPFVFLITENRTNSICFLGKINMPSYEN